MDTTSFRFLLTMPGDSRLITIIRELATQAATYANLPTDDTGALAKRVTDAAEAAIAAGAPNAPLEVRFVRSADALRVTITWRSNGREERREVEHRISA